MKERILLLILRLGYVMIRIQNLKADQTFSEQIPHPKHLLPRANLQLRRQSLP